MTSTFMFGGVLAAILAAITWIDARQQIIPDGLNALLAISGWIYQQISEPETLLVQAASSVIVFASLWSIRHLYFLRRGRVGLGLGDVKMAGAAAIWLSPLALPYFIFAASLAALAFLAGRQIALKNVSGETRQPFGPFLAFSLITTWLAEQHLSSF